MLAHSRRTGQPESPRAAAACRIGCGAPQHRQPARDIAAPRLAHRCRGGGDDGGGRDLPDHHRSRCSIRPRWSISTSRTRRPSTGAIRTLRGMQPALADVDVNSQLEIIRSEKIAIGVIKQLGLIDARRIRTRPQNSDRPAWLRKGMGVIRSMIRVRPAATDDGGHGDSARNDRRVLQAPVRQPNRRDFRHGDQLYV